MSNYRTGAFEALEWAWYMLREHSDKPDGVDEARRVILEVLDKIGNGEKVNFSENISLIPIYLNERAPACNVNIGG